jgi:hypothetical protein
MRKDTFGMQLKSAELSVLFEWDKWTREIPWIQFPSDWKIKIIPPTVGTIVRFRVTLPSGKEKSIYLDCYDIVGHFGSPYWEVYPIRNDIGRCSMNDVQLLISMIADESEEEK